MHAVERGREGSGRGVGVAVGRWCGREVADDVGEGAFQCWRALEVVGAAGLRGPFDEERSIGQSLRQDIFAHLQRMSLAWFDRHPVGVLTTRVTGDIESIVREELRPILKAWLDQNLTPMVERLVQREIQRIARSVD